jgi:hypothetical protein
MRGLHQLLQGNLGAAFALNPLMVTTLPLVGSLWLVETLRGLRGDPSIVARIPPRWIWIFVGVTCLYWLARNLAA